MYNNGDCLKPLTSVYIFHILRNRFVSRIYLSAHHIMSNIYQKTGTWRLIKVTCILKPGKHGQDKVKSLRAISLFNSNTHSQTYEGRNIVLKANWSRIICIQSSILHRHGTQSSHTEGGVCFRKQKGDAEWLSRYRESIPQHKQLDWRG